MRLLLFVFFLVFTATVFGQGVDSLLTDVLLNNPYQQKLDSIEGKFYQQSDSLKRSFKQQLSSLDSSRTQMEAKIDSLQGLHLPTEKYSHQLDSIKSEQQKVVASLNEKMADLKSKTVGRIKDLNLPPQLQEKVSALTKNIEGFQLPVKDLNIPSLNLPDNPLKNLDGLTSSFKSPLGNIGDLGFKDIQGHLGDVSKITDQLGGYKDDLQNIVKGNLDEVKELPNVLEQKAGDISGVGEISKQVDVLDPLLESAQNPDAIKDQAKELAKEAVVDHFAGKEEQLKQAMDKISNLKQKYSSISSLNDIPKRPPNEMRGKPLIERLRPGIAIQLQMKDEDFLTDLNPYVGYRFTTRLTSGLGWNQRIPYNFDKGTSNEFARVFGPRVFSEFKLKHGFTPRVELEMMNTFVPTVVKPGTLETQNQEWVFGAFIGLKREYQFVKKVKGTAMIMLRVFNHDPRSPYAGALNVRFGFEFPMKKKRRPVPAG